MPGSDVPPAVGGCGGLGRVPAGGLFLGWLWCLVCGLIPASALGGFHGRLVSIARRPAPVRTQLALLGFLSHLLP